MISNQILQNTIEGIKGIIKNDLCVSDAEGNTLATTSEDFSLNHEYGLSFVKSPADSQVVKGCHYFKVYVKLACKKENRCNPSYNCLFIFTLFPGENEKFGILTLLR